MPETPWGDVPHDVAERRRIVKRPGLCIRCFGTKTEYFPYSGYVPCRLCNGTGVVEIWVYAEVTNAKAP